MKFAIVDSFPQYKNAETECIIRMKKAAENLGFICHVIDSEGYFLDEERQTNRPIKHINNADVELDFILINHFISPNLFDRFAYTVMWNPVDFLSQWDYRYSTTNILSCDDFLAYDSDILIGHLKSMLRPSGRVTNGFLSFVPSCAGPLIAPSIERVKEPKIFYCGINWERVGNSKGRHHDLFMDLDRMNIMEFYGPVRFLGSRPWKGFKSFKGDIPFDGETLIKKVSDASIALILSSNAHRASHAPTNRLYEACSAGALVISDDNPFVQRVFGDSVLYVQYDKNHKKMAADIRSHYDWVLANPKLAADKARMSQDIYRRSFTMEGQMKALSEYHPSRQNSVRSQVYGSRPQKIGIFACIKSNSEKSLNTLKSITALDHGPHTVRVILLSPFDFAPALAKSLENLKAKEIFEICTFKDNLPLGRVLLDNAQYFSDGKFDQFCFVTAGEILYHDYLLHNAGVLEKNEKAMVSISPVCEVGLDVKADRTSFKLREMPMFITPPSIGHLNEILPASCVFARATLFDDFTKWPIDLAEHQLFSFLAFKALLSGCCAFGYKVSSSIDQQAPILNSPHKQREIEALCLSEYFRHNFPVILAQFFEKKFRHERLERRVIAAIDKKIAFRIYGRTPVQWLKNFMIFTHMIDK